MLQRLTDVTILLQRIRVVTILLHRIACNCYNVFDKRCNNGIFHCYACYNALLQALETPFFFASSRTIPGEKSSQAGWAKVEVENPGKLDPQEIEFKFHDQIFANQSLRWGPEVRAQPSCYVYSTKDQNRQKQPESRLF